MLELSAQNDIQGDVQNFMEKFALHTILYRIFPNSGNKMNVTFFFLLFTYTKTVDEFFYRSMWAQVLMDHRFMDHRF